MDCPAQGNDHLSRRCGKREALLTGTVYLLLALWAAWPLPRNIHDSLPVGTEEATTVPVFNLWSLWWNADRGGRFFADYWQAPIFHPTADAFAFSEAQPTLIAVAPIVWCGGSLALAYNVYVLAALWLNGWSMFLLLRCVGLGTAAAFCAGAMALWLPFVHWQMGILQLVPLYGVVWTLHTWHRFARQPNVWDGLGLGTSFAITYFLCNHYGLFLSVLLLAAGGCLMNRAFLHPTAWLRLLPGLVLAAGMIGPVARVQLRSAESHEWKRAPALVRQLSAEPGDYADPAWPQWFPVFERADDHDRRLWTMAPGNLKILWGVMGLVLGFWLPGRRRWTAFCLVFLAAAFVLSMGPKFSVRNVIPYDWLVDYYPGFASVRNVFRFGVFVQLAIVLLAAVGLDGVIRQLLRLFTADSGSLQNDRGRTRMSVLQDWRTWARGGTAAIVTLIGLCAAWEIRPPEQELFTLPPLTKHQAWISWVEQNTQPDDVLACVPLAEGGDVFAYVRSAAWMHWQTYHQRPIVNGYSGFFPEHYRRLKGLMKTFPDQSSLQALRESGVRYCVVHGGVELDTESATSLERVFRDDAIPVEVYRLE